MHDIVSWVALIFNFYFVEGYMGMILMDPPCPSDVNICNAGIEDA